MIKTASQSDAGEREPEETCTGRKRSHSVECAFLPIQVTEKADCSLDYHTSEAEF